MRTTEEKLYSQTGDVRRKNFFERVRSVTPTTKAFIESMAAELLTPLEPLEEAVIMLAALTEGPNIRRIVQVTGYPLDFVKKIASRLIDSGLWKDGGTDYQEWNPETMKGTVCFVMDHSVALGNFRRLSERQNGKWVYQLLIYSPERTN